MGCGAFKGPLGRHTRAAAHQPPNQLDFMKQVGVSKIVQAFGALQQKKNYKSLIRPHQTPPPVCLLNRLREDFRA